MAKVSAMDSSSFGLHELTEEEVTRRVAIVAERFNIACEEISAAIRARKPLTDIPTDAFEKWHPDKATEFPAQAVDVIHYLQDEIEQHKAMEEKYYPQALRAEVERLTRVKDALLSESSDWEAVYNEAIAAEREACAKICEETASVETKGTIGWQTCTELAAAIRGRGRK